MIYLKIVSLLYETNKYWILFAVFFFFLFYILYLKPGIPNTVRTLKT